MTTEQKIELYSQLSKEEIIALLIENQRLVKVLVGEPKPIPLDLDFSSTTITHCGAFVLDPHSTARNCKNCGQSESNHFLITLTSLDTGHPEFFKHSN